VIYTSGRKIATQHEMTSLRWKIQSNYFFLNAVLVTVTQNENKINQEHFKGEFKAAEKNGHVYCAKVTIYVE